MNELTKINLSEDIPLQSRHSTTIFINTENKVVYFNKISGIDNKTGKRIAMDVEINTKVPVQVHSKSLKCGFILSISVSILSVVLSMTLAYHHCANMSLLRKQVESIMMRMENLSVHQNTPEHSQCPKCPSYAQFRDFHTEGASNINIAQPNDNDIKSVGQIQHNLTLSQRDLLVIQFNGAQQEVNMGTDPIIGPWVRDNKISSPNSHSKIELVDKHVVVKEGGLYLIYAQVVYLTHEPCCYFVWARQSIGGPRLLTTCSTANDSSSRPLGKSQISCAVQTVARLYENDIINIAQREHNRTVWLRPGYSYFGFVKLGT